ncbi:hypothetical protein M413DRAFT_78862 [Hebeloma cylindrosporum]|uniref:Peptidase S8/S53 domain-containing protein n=1 Tax=Hebeloma cylindrosporum TaxID=76867 RepID=A0A0C3BUV8_HEBCY|nr:hypothetical protein M413DRAFT_78862 [Hebeloma cylindrosporum h7]
MIAALCLLSKPSMAQLSRRRSLADMTVRHNATWGLARITQAEKLQEQNPRGLDFNYSYDQCGGDGVDVYVEFGGRAVWGATFNKDAEDKDVAGHGTHVAATIAGNQFGVAKVIGPGIRFLSRSIADHIAALKWVAQQVDESDRPSVVHVSIHGKPSDAVDEAAATLVAKGVHVVTSAGIHGIDANQTSPARVPGVLTVGVIGINDAKANFSNFGSVVDIFAPGENIVSAGIHRVHEKIWLFHSMSSSTFHICLLTPLKGAAYVTGIVAYLIGKLGNMSPAAMKALLQSTAVKDALTGIRK